MYFKSEFFRQYSSLLSSKTPLNSLPIEQEKFLKDIMKVDLIQNKNVEEIEQIWKEYHIKKDVIAATISAEMFQDFISRSKEYPVFLFPLPRSEGYEFIMSQFCRNTIHFTPLLSYQVHKENAQECLTITYYTDLEDSKGIVLMRGEFDKTVINAIEAQCLANQLQLYYGHPNENRKQLLDQFTNKPDTFKHMDLISHLQSLSL